MSKARGGRLRRQGSPPLSPPGSCPCYTRQLPHAISPASNQLSAIAEPHSQLSLELPHLRPRCFLLFSFSLLSGSSWTPSTRVRSFVCAGPCFHSLSNLKLFTYTYISHPWTVGIHRPLLHSPKQTQRSIEFLSLASFKLIPVHENTASHHVY